MAKKVYAIKEGFDFKKNLKVENKIVSTWNECLSYVKGVKGAKYKSFESMDVANEYLNDNNKLLKKAENNYPKDGLHIYVDGSFSVVSERYAYGLVCVRDGIVEYIESDASVDDAKKNIRQIAGELEASIRGLLYAKKIGEKKVVLFHDYEGIYHHAVGSWERKEQSSVEYFDMVNTMMKDGLNITFVKVDSHTGDFYNELADELCKRELNISSDKEVAKWVKSNKLYVASQELKDKLKGFVGTNIDNIKVKNLIEKDDINIIDYDVEILMALKNFSDVKKAKVLDYIKYL